MLVSAGVRFVPISSGSLSLDETINDIAIGAFASTLVAWLILIQDQKQIESRNKKLQKYVTSSVLLLLANYMQCFCNMIALNDDSLKDKKENFPKWNSLYFTKLTQQQEKPTNQIFEFDTKFLISLLQQIYKESSSINQNAVWYQKEQILTEEECCLISDIGALCKSLTLFIGKDSSAHGIKLLNEGLCDKLKQQPKWKALIDTPYSYNSQLITGLKILEE